MKQIELALNSLPVRLPGAPAALPFPGRGTVPQLRSLRERLFREGQHDQALQVAFEVAKRDPGRESFCRLGVFYREVGRYREALKTLRDALRFESGPKYLIPEIHLHLAHTWFLMGKRKRAGASLRRAYDRRPRPRTAFNYHITAGNFLFSKKEYRKALAEYVEAERSAPDAAARGKAIVNQGIILVQLRRLPEAAEPLDRAIDILRRTGRKAELAIARSMRACLHIEEGQFQRALGMLLHAAEAYRAMGKADREAGALTDAGYAAAELGQWAECRRILDRAITLASTIGQPRYLVMSYANHAIACAYNEELPKACDELTKAQRILRGKRDWIATLHFLRAKAKIAALQARWREVFRTARRAERMALKENDMVRVIEFRRMRADAEEKLGRRKASSYARNAASRLEATLGKATTEMTRLSNAAAKLASGSLPVIVLGESGTGTLDLARRLHGKGPRAEGPCIVVPCEQLAFPACDFEGNVEGAWSGAARASRGYVDQARGGTLILDRVDLLSTEGQRVLLRVVEGRIRPVGAEREQEIDVRIVATCASLDPLIPDLRNRLEGAVLRVPSLKNRKADIARIVREQVGDRRRITPDAVTELTRHRWEGNLPQLKAAVERLVALSDRRIGKQLVRAIVLTTPERRRVAGRVHVSRNSRRLPVQAL